MRRNILLLVFLLISPLPGAVADELHNVTFAVGCYDVGAAALEKRPGVLAVDKGWQGFREVNRVSYDPQLVKVEQMEQWLKQAETYRATLPQKNQE